jgi:hypothetical protein
MPSNMLDAPTYSFLAGICIGSVLVAGYVALQKQSNGQSQTKPHLPPSGDHQAVVGLDDEVIKEHLSRNLLFLGNDGCSALFHSHVVVVGLGGVGSHAAHLLLRSGVGKLTLVDFDQVNHPCESLPHMVLHGPR